MAFSTAVYLGFFKGLRYCKPGVLNLFCLVYPLPNEKSIIYPPSSWRYLVKKSKTSFFVLFTRAHIKKVFLVVKDTIVLDGVL